MSFTSVRGIDVRLTDVTLHEGGGTIAKPPGTILTADPVRCLRQLPAADRLAALTGQ